MNLEIVVCLEDCIKHLLKIYIIYIIEWRQSLHRKLHNVSYL